MTNGTDLEAEDRYPSRKEMREFIRSHGCDLLILVHEQGLPTWWAFEISHLAKPVQFGYIVRYGTLRGRVDRVLSLMSYFDAFGTIDRHGCPIHDN